VLVIAGLSAGIVSESMYQGFLSASVLTMILTPFILQVSPFLSASLSSRKLLKRLERIKELPGHDEFREKRRDHIIIIGFGLTGRNLAKVLKVADIPYVVLEMNIATVKKMKEHGEPIYYGDGTKLETLHRLGIKTAKTMVVVISDPPSCRSIVKAARGENPSLFILTRTRFTSEVDDLLKLGANEVIPDEFEASVEIFSRVLDRYDMPKNEIFNYVDMIREDGYRALRNPKAMIRKPLFDKHLVLSDVTVDRCTIKADSRLSGISIEESRFRTKTGATIIAVEREKKMHNTPGPKFILEAGDTLLFIGKREDINRALVYLTEA
jgi:CPA2 family monovalent cation:H+ antiporter-2